MELNRIQEKIMAIYRDQGNRKWTREQMKEALGLKSKELVQYHLNRLVARGYLKPNQQSPSGYIPYTIPKIPLVYLNLYGKAKCGPGGNILSGKPEDRLPIAARLIKGEPEEAFLVFADGDSMAPDIQDADMVIGSLRQTAENGDIVIGALNGEAFIKRFRRVNQDQILLESLNPAYEPMVVTEQDQLSIEGQYVGLIRGC